jgi:hypothetical protein
MRFLKEKKNSRRERDSREEGKEEILMISQGEESTSVLFCVQIFSKAKSDSAQSRTGFGAFVLLTLLMVCDGDLTLTKSHSLRWLRAL